MSSVLYKTNQDIPKDMLLGNMSFVNLTDMRISESDLLSIFQNNGIPESYVRKISKADAFRRATSKVKNSTINFVNPNTNILETLRIDVDEVRCDNDSIKRIIGCKRIDDTSEDIKYDSVAEIIFNRDTGTISCIDKHVFDYVDAGNVVSPIKPVCDLIENRYIEWAVYHTKDTIKNIINRIIWSTHPVNLMPTGLCKFIPATYTDLMYKLKNALDDLSDYSCDVNENNVMEIIPIIDTEEQRNLVKKNFTLEMTNELFDFTQELKDVLQNKTTLSTRSAKGYIEKFQTLKVKAKEYESLLGIYVDSIYTQIKAALEMVADNTDASVDIDDEE